MSELTSDDLDALFTCLASRRRRRLIESVAAKSGPVPYEELAQFISDRKDGVNEPVSTETVDGVRIALIHNDLPKLDSAGVIELDSEERTVHPGDRFDHALSLLGRV